MTIIIHANMGVPEKVVAFDSQHDPLPYIKEHLRKWDDSAPFQDAVDDIETVEDAIALLEEEAIYALMVYEVDEVNPEEKKEG